VAVGVAGADGAGLADLPVDGAGVGDPAPGAEGDPGWPGGLPLFEPGAPAAVSWSSGLVPACCGLCCAVAGGCGAAHCVNGACGPPVIATTMATRQAATAAIEPNPANRRIWWRRPDGSVKTGLDSTGGF
jgi:hypothetical protein